jgi:hypothetical protein
MFKVVQRSSKYMKVGGEVMIEREGEGLGRGRSTGDCVGGGLF